MPRKRCVSHAHRPGHDTAQAPRLPRAAHANPPSHAPRQRQQKNDARQPKMETETHRRPPLWSLLLLPILLLPRRWPSISVPRRGGRGLAVGLAAVGGRLHRRRRGGRRLRAAPLLLAVIAHGLSALLRGGGCGGGTVPGGGRVALLGRRLPGHREKKKKQWCRTIVQPSSPRPPPSCPPPSLPRPPSRPSRPR